MITTSVLTIGLLCVGSAAGGFILAAMFAAQNVIFAENEARRWKGEFNRAIADLAESSKNRDELAYQVKSMKPLYEKGVKRQAAIEKAKQKVAA